MNRIVRLTIFVFFALLAQPRMSAEEAASARKAAEPNPVTFSLFASHSLFSGNSRGWSLAAQSKLSVLTRKYSLQTFFERYYGKTGDEVSINRGKIVLNANRSLKKNVNASSTALFEMDRITDLKRRINLGAGISYEDRRRPRYVYSLTTNILYEVTTFDRPEKPETDSFRLQMRAAAQLNLRDTTRFEISLLHNSALQDVANDYRLELDTSLRMMMIRPLWIKVSFQDRYNNLVASEAIKKNDFTVLTGLELNL
jgi:hypothetical protein